jgi:DNA polymerase-3 subunit epsilon
MSLSQQVKRIDWIETEGEIGALLKESELIKRLQPTHNQRLRRAGELCSWQLQIPEADGGQNGAQGPYIKPVLRRASELQLGRQEGLYGLFGSVRDANKQLTDIADEKLLCRSHLGLEKTSPGKPCFAYQLGQCSGACVGKPVPALYNASLRAALVHLKVLAWPFAGPVAVREGKDWHVVDSWCYLGTARREDELHALLDGGTPQFDKDTYNILRTRLPTAQIRKLA